MKTFLFLICLTLSFSASAGPRYQMHFSNVGSIPCDYVCSQYSGDGVTWSVPIFSTAFPSRIEPSTEFTFVESNVGGGTDGNLDGYAGNVFFRYTFKSILGQYITTPSMGGDTRNGNNQFFATSINPQIPLRLVPIWGQVKKPDGTSERKIVAWKRISN